MDAKEIIGCTFAMILMVINFVGWSFIGAAWQDQKLCENGATEYCMKGE